VNNKKNQAGQVLVGVLVLLAIILMLTPQIITMMQNESKWTIKQQKSTDAFNLANGALERGRWKLKSSTSTWITAARGVAISGYNFDTTYRDLSGGTYRIQFSSGPGERQVTIRAEGRDELNKETRSLQEVVQNQTIYSAMMSRGDVSWSIGLVVFWGPIISQGNITLADDTVAGIYYPRKYARGVVLGRPGNQRDTNGLTPPNTDNVEWWSEYEGVPEVPILDFTALRSSAAATGTLNVYGCRSSFGVAGACGNAARWDTRGACTSSGPHAVHFGNPWCHPLSAKYQPNTDTVWYWDGDVTFSGGSSSNQSCGLRGTVIVRGNLTIDTPGEYTYTGTVPANAWREHNKFLINTYDSATTKEYPADNGLHQTKATFNFGSDTFGVPGLGAGPYVNTIGVRGFTYVGGNLTILQYMDFNGAVWVNGTVTASGGSMSHSCGIFYNDDLEVPALNVILIRQSWKEVPPSSTAWAS
jgi:hypothetical protein